VWQNAHEQLSQLANSYRYFWNALSAMTGLSCLVSSTTGLSLIEQRFMFVETALLGGSVKGVISVAMMFGSSSRTLDLRCLLHKWLRCVRHTSRTLDLRCLLHKLLRCVRHTSRTLDLRCLLHKWLRCVRRTSRTLDLRCLLHKWLRCVRRTNIHWFVLCLSFCRRHQSHGEQLRCNGRNTVYSAQCAARIHTHTWYKTHILNTQKTKKSWKHANKRTIHTKKNFKARKQITNKKITWNRKPSIF